MEPSLIISLGSLVVALFALAVNYRSWQRRDILAMRPVLVFEYESTGWRIHNVGAGPALDVVFTRLANGAVHDHVRLPALAKDGALQLHFAKHDNVHSFAATYRDWERRPYTSYSARDVSAVRAGFGMERPEGQEIPPWWSLPERDL